MRVYSSDKRIAEFSSAILCESNRQELRACTNCTEDCVQPHPNTEHKVVCCSTRQAVSGFCFNPYEARSVNTSRRLREYLTTPHTTSGKPSCRVLFHSTLCRIAKEDVSQHVTLDRVGGIHTLSSPLRKVRLRADSTTIAKNAASRC